MSYCITDGMTAAPQPVDEHKTKRIEYLIPLELDEREPLGNAYKQVLADPARRSMNYAKTCIIGRDRAKCMKADLLAQLYRQYAEESPEDLERGLPGPDMNAFVNFPIECQTCILHRSSPWSEENARDTGASRTAGFKRSLGNNIWGIAAGAIILFWTVGIGRDSGLGQTPTILAGVGLGILTFFVVRELPALLGRRHHAHGPAEVADHRERLRSRTEPTPADHESNDEASAPPQTAAPVDAGEPKADPPLPEADQTGGDPDKAPIPEPVPLVFEAVTGPGEDETKDAQGSEGPTLEERVKDGPPTEEPEPLERAPVDGRKESIEAPPEEPRDDASMSEAQGPAPSTFLCPTRGCGRSFSTQAGLNRHRSVHKTKRKSKK